MHAVGLVHARVIASDTADRVAALLAANNRVPFALMTIGRQDVPNLPSVVLINFDGRQLTIGFSSGKIGFAGRAGFVVFAVATRLLNDGHVFTTHFRFELNYGDGIFGAAN